ncbi:LLM class flavin-dependent oxidoreductase [Mesorhizobium sp. IMUNJ 23232]|uniref:LLM class flavin-dependent oxidoreductase n=1 Tax=Mesorhizobium sp. IMUNJ 23232 TaxID=3376064 RepID=UPI00379E3BCC
MTEELSMHIEFTHVPGPFRATAGEAATPFFFDIREAQQRLTTIERAGFDRVVVDDAAGLLTNMDLAAQAMRSTSALDISLTHWAGAVEPTVAARQLAALDAFSHGRLSIRIMTTPHSGVNGEPAGHVETLQRTDEYLVLLKRLWANDRPFDHEGPAYSMRNGFVARKGPRGAEIPFRMNGLSGTAFRAAGRHADVFELPFATPDHIGHIVQRVCQAATECGRTGRLRFALPLRFDQLSQQGGDARGIGDLGAAIRGGSSERIALALLPYVSLGVCEFMIGGLNEREAIADFGERVIPIVRNSAARRDRVLAIWPQPAESVPLRSANKTGVARH